MRKGKLIVTKETKTGRNIEFQDTRNHQKLSVNELISRLESGKSSYNEDYCVKTGKNDLKYVASKPDNSKKNNLE